MDWALAIHRNREALLRMIAALFALTGLAEGETAGVLPRHIYRAVLLVLRPAESAVRRLIIIVAHGLVRNFGDSLLNSSRGATKNNQQLWQELNKLSPNILRKFPCFRLIEPLKRFTFDRFKPISCPPPRISVPGFIDPVFAVPMVAAPDDLIKAQQLFRRLNALKKALDDLSKQARRLACWQARRVLRTQQRKPMRLSPFRVGRPPGYRARMTHEIDGVLRECHALMLDRLAEPDTS